MKPPGHYSKQAVSASLAHFVLGRSIGMLLAFALLLLLVRVLPAGAYGTYVTLLSLLEVVQIVSSVGLILAAQRYLPELRAANRNAALLRLLSRLLVARAVTLGLAVAACYPLAGWIVSFFGVDASAAVVRLYLAIVFFEGIARYVEVCQDSLLRQKASQSTMLLRTALRLSMLGAMAYGAGPEVDLTDWLLIDLSASVAGCLFGLASLFRFMRALPAESGTSRESDTELYARARRYLPPAYGAQVLYTAWSIETIKLVAARLVGAAQMAPFGFAAVLNSMLVRYLPVFLLMNLVRPLFVAARVRDDYRTRLPFMATMMFKLNVFVLAPVLALLVVAHTELADLLTGGRFPESGQFLLLLAPVLLAQGLRGGIGLVSHAMELGNANLVGTALGTGGLVVGVLAAYYLDLRFLCLGLLLSEVALCLYSTWALRRRQIMVSLDLASLARIALSAGVSGLVIWGTLLAMLQWPPVARLALAFFFGTAVYLLVARLIRPFRASERDLINSILKRDFFHW